jgi:paraquat-inducible protein B
VLEVTGRVERMLATLERGDASDEVLVALRNVNEVLHATQATVARFDRAEVGQRASGTLHRLDGSVSKLNAILDRVDGDGGLLASATKATKAFGAIGQGGRQTQRDLDGALRDMSDAADAIRSLARAVERDPEMLLKGKTEGRAFK